MNVIIQWSINNILQQGYFLDHKLHLKMTQNAVFSWGEKWMCRELTTALVLLNFSTEYKAYTGWINVLTILAWVFQLHVCNYIAYVMTRVRRYLCFSLNQKMFHIQRQLLAVAKVSELSHGNIQNKTSFQQDVKIKLDE